MDMGEWDTEAVRRGSSLSEMHEQIIALCQFLGMSAIGIPQGS